ncbi:hypothetical protein P7C71_g5608, partial [Lecanoromycetidae sp. Uapishka_2]
MERSCQWRSSPAFIISTITVGFFGHLYLYGFVVPILPYMLEHRIGLDPSNTQTMISSLLTVHALTCIISNPIVGHYADKLPDRKRPLLLGLCGELAGTIVVASTKQLPLLFLGRIAQAASGTILWVVGFATMADTVGANQMGMTIGIVTAFVSLGTSAGPMLAGVLLEKVGYWPAWASAIAVLLVDIAMRTAMIENPKYRTGALQDPSVAVVSDSVKAPVVSSVSRRGSLSSEESVDERSALLSHSLSPVTELSGIRFYTYLLKRPRFAAAMWLYMMNGIVLVSLDTTLPLHVEAKFQWGSYLAGMMFLVLQAPGILLCPFFGWLRDRVGTRYPTGIAFLLIAPDLCIMGMPSYSYTSWAQGERAEAIYVTSVVVLGVLMSSLNGVGSIEGGPLREHIGYAGMNMVLGMSDGPLFGQKR